MESLQNQSPNNEPQYNKVSYVWAWLAFIASVISIIVTTKPPQKDDYKK